MGEAKMNAESVKVRNMKAKLNYALGEMKKIQDLATSESWGKLSALDQEFYTAENAAWKTVARIINIRLKIEIGKAIKGKQNK